MALGLFSATGEGVTVAQEDAMNRENNSKKSKPSLVRGRFQPLGNLDSRERGNDGRGVACEVTDSTVVPMEPNAATFTPC